MVLSYNPAAPPHPNSLPSFLTLPNAPGASTGAAASLPSTVPPLPAVGAANAVGAVATSNNDEETFAPNPSISTGPTALEKGAFKRFYCDQRALDPKYKMAYIILMKADLHNVKAKTAYSESISNTLRDGGDVNEMDPPGICTPQTFAESYEVFENFMNKKGNKGKLILTKAMIFNELERRVPNIQTDKKTRVNMKNTKVPELMELLTKYSITCTDDIAFIEQEFLRLEILLEKEASEEGGGRKKYTQMEDRLRVIIILATNDIVRAKYLSHTDGMDRTTLDYQNSDQREQSWAELLCDIFNDDETEIVTKALPNLHDKFKDPIVCARKCDPLTPDRCKDIMSSMKKKVVDIIRKYNMSGNGSDMAKFYEDDEDIGGAEDTRETYGRFNRDLAIKRAHAKGREDLVLMDGDDRKEFLHGNTPDLLYWWMLMDENDLIYIFVGMLNSNNSASSDVTPAPTSRRTSSNTTGSAATELTNGKKGNESLSKEMVDNVSRLNKTVSVVASTAVRSSIDALKTKRFDLEDQLDEFEDMDLSELSGREKKKYD
ncbi:hypothetical protein HJC23_000789 [Cyclotella cryptica]|uniref:Uncharacterized protein n=1 Tax=Cyclotella cryptica TaxID=29204 RepID=A0ABD3PZM8_9STRA